MARPRVAAGALIRNDAGEILLVKPTYKEGWEIPGGYVEPGESPKAACEREIREELGLDLEVGQLAVVDWAPSEAEGDKILFIFVCDAPHLGRVSLPPSELAAARYQPVTLLESLLPARLARRVGAALRASVGTYLEHGSIPEVRGT